MPDNLEERLLPLSSDDYVNIGRGQCLIRQQRGVPSPENHRKAGVEPLCLGRNPDCLAHHGSGYQGDGKAQRIVELRQNTTLKSRRDRGIDDAYLVAGTQQRGGYCQDAERSCRFQTGESREEEDDFIPFGTHPEDPFDDGPEFVIPQMLATRSRPCKGKNPDVGDNSVHIQVRCLRQEITKNEFLIVML